MNSLPLRGIPLGWRLALIREKLSAQSVVGLDSWRSAASLEGAEAWHQRLAAVGVDEGSFAAAVAPDYATFGQAPDDDDSIFPAARRDLQLLAQCARLRAKNRRFILDLIEDLLIENSPLGRDFAGYRKEDTEFLGVLAAGIRDEVLERFSEMISGEFHAMQAAGIIDRDASQSLAQEKFLAILQVEGSVEYLLEEYPTLPFHIHNFIRHCMKISSPFFPVNGRPSRVSAAQSAMAREGEFLAKVLVGTRFDAIGGDQSLELQSNNGAIWRPVDREVANIRWFLNMVNWLESRGIDLGAKRYLFREDQEGGWLGIPAEDHNSSSTTPPGSLYEFGALAAVFYVAGSHHMTREVVSIRGNHPVIDRMDTLFSNGPLRQTNPNTSVNADPTHSVMSSLLLPRWKCDFSGNVLSGNMGLLERLLSLELPIKSRSDRNSTGSEIRESELQSRFQEKGALEAIVEGFEECYLRIMSGREELLSSDWYCREDSGITGRVVLQDGWRYGILGKKIYSPAMLADALQTDQLLETLWRGVGTKTPPTVVQYEIDSLWKGQCPQYWSSSNGTALYADDERILVDKYFKYGIVHRIKDRTRSLSRADLKRQISYIVQSCSIFSNRPGFQPVDWNEFWRSSGILTADTEKSDVRIGVAAQFARDVLVASAPSSEKDNWLGVSRDDSGNWQLGGIPHGLSSGLDGIGLFLLYFQNVTNDPECGNAFRLILQSAVNRLSIALSPEHSPLAGSPLNAPIFSCAFFLAQSFRCGERLDHSENLLRRFWVCMKADIGLSESPASTTDLASKLRLMAGIYDCLPCESALAVLADVALQLASRISKSLENSGWSEWYPSSYSALRSVEALVQGAEISESVAELETRLLDHLDIMQSGVNFPHSAFVSDVDVITAQKIFIGILMADSDLEPKSRQRFAYSLTRYLEQYMESKTVGNVGDTLRHYCLLDAVVWGEERGYLNLPQTTGYRNVQSVLDKTLWRPAVKGAPVPFQGLAGGLAGVGIASLRGSHRSEIPFPWFML